MKKTQISVNLDLEDAERLEDLSRETGLSLSSLIRQAVKGWLKTSAFWREKLKESRSEA